MADRAVHYAGELRYLTGRMTTHVGAGYAACCSGGRAYRIAEAGAHTEDRAVVTCKRCLSALARESVPCANCKDPHPANSLAPVTVPWSTVPLRLCPACVERGVASGVLTPRASTGGGRG